MKVLDTDKCRWKDGYYCKKGLPGTICNIVGCVAYSEKEDEK